MDERKWSSEFTEAHPVGGHLQDVLKQSYTPADEDDADQAQVLTPAHFLELQMTVPGERHEGVGGNEEEDGDGAFHYFICLL